MRPASCATVAAMVLVAVAVLAACAGGPESRNRGVPDWALHAPEPSATHEYFVAAGSDATGDRSAAEEAAVHALLERINQALGVEITVLTTAEARSTLDAYRAEVVRLVTQQAEGRVEGLRIAGRSVVKEAGGRVTVYLLGEYERGAFEREAVARRQIVLQREALVLEPERRAIAAAREGQRVEAFELALIAAHAAARGREEGVRIAPVVLERSLQLAAGLSEGLLVEAVSGPASVQVGTAPDVPILFRVSAPGPGAPDASGDAARVAVPGIRLEVAYREQRGAQTTVRTAVLETDREGVARFEHPPLTVVGPTTVTGRIDMPRATALLRDLPPDTLPTRRVIEASLASARATWRFSGVSRAREVPTAVVVVDTDASGTPLPAGRTAEGVRQALAEAGFLLIASGIEEHDLVGRTHDEMVAWLRMTAPPGVSRVIAGYAEIAGLTERDGYLAQVAGTLTVIDLAASTVISAITGFKNAHASTAAQALATAFLQLGHDLGRRLAATLP